MAEPYRPRVALFGAGGYGANHVRILEQLHSQDLVELIAVADPATHSLSELKSRLEARGVRWYEDYTCLLGDIGNTLDVVVIATPIPLHLPMLKAALDLQLAVYMEKPPIPLIQDFLAISRLSEAAWVGVDFQRMAETSLWTLKRAMADGALGAIRLIAASACWPRLDSYYARASWAGRLTWNDLAVLDGPATNAMAHIIHNIMFLAGESVPAFSVPESVCGELYRVRPLESYDLCCLGGIFSSGIRFAGAFAHCVKQRREWSITVQGDEGWAVLGPGEVVFHTGNLLPPEVAPEPDIFAACCANYFSFVRGERAKPLTSFADCLGYVVATNALFASSGGIHSVPTHAFERYGYSGDGGYDLTGLNAYVDELHRSGRTFSEQGVAWAVPGRSIRADTLTRLPVEELFCERSLPV